MKLSLIKTEEGHILELVRISKDAFESDVLVGAPIGDVPPQYDSVEWHMDMMKEGHLFTAIVDEKIVGGAILFFDSKNNTVYIGRIFVDPAEFKKGYGMAIMKEIESMYSNVSAFHLDTPEWNVRTNRFYKKLGYKELKKEEGFVFYQKYEESLQMENVIAKLSAKDDRYACAIADKIISESLETDEWYEYLDDFASLLNHPKSLVRNRALHILAANAQWDDANRFDSIISDFLAHVTDEKPITARQCIKALAQVGVAKPQYIPQILSHFHNADLSKYKDTMRPLIEKDMVETEKILADSDLEKQKGKRG